MIQIELWEFAPMDTIYGQHHFKLLLLLPVYSAGENVSYDFNYDNFVRDIKSQSNIDVIYANEDEIKDNILKNTNSGDIVIFTGAGDINVISKRICQEL